MKKEGTDFDFEAFARAAAEQLRSGKPMVGSEGVFTPLLKPIIESAMEGELDDHLDTTRKTEKNRRNGKGAKNLQSPLGGFEIFAPRDRTGSFQPQTYSGLPRPDSIFGKTRIARLRDCP